MFRGKFLAGFKLLYDTGQLTFPKSTVKLKNPNEWKAFINRLYEKDWCPFIKETFNGHGNALQYLARYSYRTAISNSRIISTDEGYVTLSYKDYRDGEKKQLSLPGEEFIRRFLIHILPKGFTRIRFSGYLANCVRKQNLKKIHKARNTLYRGNPVAKVSASELLMLIYDCDISQCPCCGLTMNFGRSKSREVLME